MEHAMDVSWMTHGKDKLAKVGAKIHSNGHPAPAQDQTSAVSGQPLEAATPSKVNEKSASSPSQSPSPSPSPTPAKNIPGARPIASRKNSGDRDSSGERSSPSRRGSWLANISSKFSQSSANGASAQAVGSPPISTPQPIPEHDEVAPLPKITPSKNAVLQHGSRQNGDGPYVPAPPKSGQPGFLGVLRRLSSSNGSIPPPNRNNHGLVDRRVLNVDRHRERCRLGELNQAKLRRVAFCVDVEIAPMPKYVDGDAGVCKPVDKTTKRKLTEKGEGDALKNSKAVEAQNEEDGAEKPAGEVLPKEPEKEGPVAPENEADGGAAAAADAADVDEKPEKETTRKKEKKKKSEAERKAKKEQRKKEALEKGAIPMEIHLDSDSSLDDGASTTGAPKAQITPTTNPGRIYRRCCQLRETDILTKITNQLPKSSDKFPNGIVDKLDLTGYYMSLPDLMTLGDFLAVVPVRDVVLENCGLTDEGVRVILAGLLAAKRPTVKHRKPATAPADLVVQGGVVERLVLKNNTKIGSEGWKHICLFIHMCRSIKCLDVSSIPFPTPSEPSKAPIANHLKSHNGYQPLTALDISLLMCKALGERLAGPELELLNLSGAGLTTAQLDVIIGGILKSGVKRLGLAHNHLDGRGVQLVVKYLSNGNCESIDLGGNDLRHHLDTITDALNDDSNLWALSLANCNLEPKSICKLMPKLTKLENFKFMDLAHNHDLFETDPSAIGTLRRHLPNMKHLKRIHLNDVGMSPEQAIALAEILPEVSELAHINLLENPKLAALSDAKSEDDQEEACALHASLLAAARTSDTLIKIDIESPSAESGELLKALANQTIAYCMRNLREIPDLLAPATEGLDKYPDVLKHLVGYEEDEPIREEDVGGEPAPDQDFVLGGQGVVKALAACLNNRSDESRRPSGEFSRDFENGSSTPRAQLPPGKAKNMSKHLLASARKIRVRLQPALAVAKANASTDMSNYQRFLFLNSTIEGIIKRFEDEFPETRVTAEENAPSEKAPSVPDRIGTSEASVEEPVFTSDNEDFETDLRSPLQSRSNSMISFSSKALADEEARMLRMGHKFRSGFLKPEHFDALFDPALSSPSDPVAEKHLRALTDLTESDLAHDEDMQRLFQEKGVLRAFHENREEIFSRLREKDPGHWDRFIESQEKASANKVGHPVNGSALTNGLKQQQEQQQAADEEAISD